MGVYTLNKASYLNYSFESPASKINYPGIQSKMILNSAGKDFKGK